MNISEIWRPVVGYEGLYEVSNFANVRSIDRWVTFKNGRRRLFKGRILEPWFSGSYFCVRLSKNGKSTPVTVHKLVAMAFPEICGEWFPGAEVDHKDGNPLNNMPDNLWWCTHAQNNNNPITQERKHKALKGKRLNRPDMSKPVVQYTKSLEFVAEFPSCREAGRCTGILYNSILGVCKGRLKTAGGFKWQYK